MAADSMLHDDVRSHIAKGDVLVVVGAGVSMGATKGKRVASWTGLLENGAKRCREVCSLSDDWLEKKQADLASGDMDDLLAVAEIVASKLGSPAGGEYRRWLRETVGGLRAASRDVLEALRDLKVPIATTNYDGLLEEVTGWPAVTWQDGAKVERVIRRRRPGGPSPPWLLGQAGNGHPRHSRLREDPRRHSRANNAKGNPRDPHAPVRGLRRGAA